MDFHEAIEQGLRNAPFVAHLGITPAGAAATTQLERGEHVVEAVVRPRHDEVPVPAAPGG